MSIHPKVATIMTPPPVCTTTETLTSALVSECSRALAPSAKAAAH